jgi:hypothetical protein
MPTLDVCVVGEINLDLILYGLPKQLVLDRELLASGLALTLGSSSAIFAHNLAMLGNKVGFISKTGVPLFRPACKFLKPTRDYALALLLSVGSPSRLS